MSAYEVTFPAVDAARVALAGVATQLREELHRLNGAVSGIVDTGWRGRAARAFELDWQEWRCAADDVVRVLDELALTLGAGAAGYETIESGVRRAMAR